MNSKKDSKNKGAVRIYSPIYEFIKWTGALPMLAYLHPKRYFINKKSYKELKGGFIVVANHRAHMDPMFLSCVLPTKRIFFLAQEQLFETPFKAWLFTQFNCIKIDRRNVSPDTFRAAGQVLKAGKVLGIFPEGRIQGEEGGDFKGGCSMIALINRVPILPVYLEKQGKPFRKTRVIIGEPIFPRDIVGDSQSLSSIDTLSKHLQATSRELEEYCNNIKGSE